MSYEPPKWIVERCTDCAYLVEGDNGVWMCDDAEWECEKIIECILDEDTIWGDCEDEDDLS